MAATITEEQKKYEELRKELLTRLGQKDENGELKIENGVVFLGDNNDEYIKQHQELLGIDIELDRITVDELADAELSVSDLINLGDLVVE